MKKTKDRLRAMGVLNMHYMLKTWGKPRVDDIGLRYSVPPSRSMKPRGTDVHSPSHQTDPKSHWMDYGRKFFGGPRAQSMPAAEAWASEKYGIAEWAPCPFGGRIPATVRARMLAALKKAAP